MLQRIEFTHFNFLSCGKNTSPTEIPSQIMEVSVKYAMGETMTREGTKAR